MNTKRNIWITVACCVAFAGLMVAGLVNKLNQPPQLSPQELYQHGVMLLDPPRRFSDFELLDQHGEVFTHADLEGKWTLIFPGFTFCPDICPTTMATLNRLYSSLDEAERQVVQVVLLSVDPERDTPEQLEPYVSYFNPEFVGLTGSPAYILSLATQLNVVYTKVPLDGDEYTMDHSSNVMIINPRGDYHGFFRPPLEENAMRPVLRSIIAGFQG